MTFRAKITILLLVFTMFPLIIIGGGIYFYGKSTLERNAGSHLNYLAEKIVEEANTHFQNYYTSFEGLSQLSVMEGVVNNDRDGHIEAFLKDFVSQNPEIEGMEALDVQGLSVAATSANPRLKVSFSDGKLFQQAVKGVPHFSDAFFDDRLEHWIIEFAFPIYASGNKDQVIGVLRVRWNAGHIAEEAKEYASRYRLSGKGRSTEGLEMFLLNGDGVVISQVGSSENQKMIRNIFQDKDFLKEVEGQRKKGYYVKEGGHKPVGFIFDQDNLLVGYSFPKRDGDDSLVTPWGGVVTQRADIAFAAVKNLHYTILTFGVVIIFLVIGMSVIISGWLSGPLVKMAHAADQLVGGDVGVHIEYDSDDELGVLARSFNKMVEDIDHQRRGLINAQAHSDAILNSVAEAIIVIDTKGIIQEFNRGSEQIFGFKASEAIGKNVKMLMPSPYQEEHDGHLRNYMRTGKAKILGKPQRDLQGLRKDGSVFPLILGVSELVSPVRKERLFIGILMDITERKQIEEEMARMARFPDENPNPVLRIDQHGKVLYSNKAGKIVQMALDFQVGEFIGDYGFRILTEVMKEQKMKTVEIMYMDMQYSLDFLPISEYGYINIYGQNITEQRKAGYELKESEARTSSIVRAAVDGIITVNDRGSIELFNPAASRMLGYTSEEIVGKNFKKLLTDDLSDEQYSQYMTNYLMSGESKGFSVGTQEVSARHKSGRVIPVDLSLSEIVMGNGQRLFIAIIRDITERKRAEEEIHKAMVAKDEFTSMVSHELRTPLAISKEALSLLLRRKLGDVPPKQEEIIAMASANIDRLGYLINDILDATKVSAGKMTLHREMVNVIDTIKENFEGWRLKAETKHLDFQLNISSNILLMSIDKMRFMQILSNLISNAIKFTPEFGKVIFTVEDMPNMVKFIVEDSGEGMAKEDLVKIFQKFQQLKRKYGEGIQGTGLGLSITKSFVELHGGQIFVDSELGKGSTFVFTLPKVYQEDENRSS